MSSGASGTCHREALAKKLLATSWGSCTHTTGSYCCPVRPARIRSRNRARAGPPSQMAAHGAELVPVVIALAAPGPTIKPANTGR